MPENNFTIYINYMYLKSNVTIQTNHLEPKPNSIIIDSVDY